MDVLDFCLEFNKTFSFEVDVSIFCICQKKDESKSMGSHLFIESVTTQPRHDADSCWRYDSSSDWNLCGQSNGLSWFGQALIAMRC